MLLLLLQHWPIVGRPLEIRDLRLRLLLLLLNRGRMPTAVGLTFDGDFVAGAGIQNRIHSRAVGHRFDGCRRRRQCVARLCSSAVARLLLLGGELPDGRSVRDCRTLLLLNVVALVRQR